MTYRVIQWSTGNVGRYALRGIIGHPDLELVGLWVHSEEKAGRDAGELCGLPRVGVTATNDADALVAIDADCVVYTATGDVRPYEVVNDLVPLLRSGKNVVSSSIVPLVWPAHVDASIRDPLQAACIEGSASCFTSGIDPGFANDVLPLVLSGVSERIESVRVIENLNYATYDQPEVLFETMGFGKPPDHTPILLIPGVLSLAWGGVVKQLAAGLGIEIDAIKEHYERRPAERSFDVGKMTVEAGTTAGLRFEVVGVAKGNTRIVVEHVTRMAADIAPDWPAPPGKGGYVVEITGSPNIRCEFTLEGDDGDENSGGLIVTAMRLVNAVPAVCDAQPGLLSSLDLPLVTGKGLVGA